MTPSSKIRRFLQLQFQAHPWHGISAQPSHGRPLNDESPHIHGSSRPLVGDHFHAFIELTPTDGVKYEVDKETGHIKVDRPQKFSNLCPTLYGFIPRTYCGKRSGDFCSKQLDRDGIEGDGDPLDICVLTEKPIGHTGIIVSARPIGGLRMIDGNEADDKIIAVLEGDVTYGHMRSIEDLPPGLLDRLRQYFLTYKMPPPNLKPDGTVATALPQMAVEIPQVYGREEALQVITHTLDDYVDNYGSHHEDLAQFLFDLAHTVNDHSRSVATGKLP